MQPFIVGPDGRPLEINSTPQPETVTSDAAINEEFRKFTEAKARRVSTVNKKEGQ
jgi:hypothetical protein